MKLFIALKRIALLCTTGMIVSSAAGFLWSSDPMLIRLYHHHTATPVKELEEVGAITLHADVISKLAQEDVEDGYDTWIFVGKKVAEDTYLEGQDISDNATFHFVINGVLAMVVWYILFLDLTRKPAGGPTDPSPAPSGLETQ